MKILLGDGSTGEGVESRFPVAVEVCSGGIREGKCDVGPTWVLYQLSVAQESENAQICTMAVSSRITHNVFGLQIGVGVSLVL